MITTQEIDRELKIMYPRSRARLRAWLRSPAGREALADLRTGRQVLQSVRRQLLWREIKEFVIGMAAAAIVLSGLVAVLVWLAKGAQW